jgi:hypothetical protein
LARAIRINPAAGASLPFPRELQYDVRDQFFDRVAALIAWMQVVRVDELVKDLRPPKAAALRAVLDKFINTNRNAVQAIKAAFWAFCI